MSARRVNVYACVLGHWTVTVEPEGGVTPMLLRCRTGAGCTLLARSTGYRAEHQGLEATHEWYRPSREEQAAAEPAMRDHFRQGGFALRALPGRPVDSC